MLSQYECFIKPSFDANCCLQRNYADVIHPGGADTQAWPSPWSWRTSRRSSSSTTASALRLLSATRSLIGELRKEGFWVPEKAESYKRSIEIAGGSRVIGGSFYRFDEHEASPRPWPSRRAILIENREHLKFVKYGLLIWIYGYG